MQRFFTQRLTNAAQLQPKVSIYSLSVGVEGVGGPAIHETRISGEPQCHHKDEERQDAALSVAHGPQSVILLLDHLICRLLFLRRDRTTTPHAPQAAVDKAELSNATLFTALWDKLCFSLS